MSLARAFTLSNGIRMPYVGLGTYRVRDQATLETCLLEALQAGYRLIDTASVYRNEAAIGHSLKRILEQNLVPGLTRQDIFLTSKLAPKDQGYDACLQAVEESLKNLQVDYIDLYLIHWPGTAKLKLPDPQNAINRTESWRALEDLYHARKLRAIGVSNYTLKHLTELVERPLQTHQHQLASAAGHTTVQDQLSSSLSSSPAGLLDNAHGHARTMVIPHVHQFELHPRLFQRDLVEYCKNHRIQVQAYSSLGEGRLVSLTPPPPPPMDAHYNNTPMPGALDIMPDLIRKYFSVSQDQSKLSGQDMDPQSIQRTWAIPSDDMEGVITTSSTTKATNNDNRSDVEISQSEYTRRSAQILLRWGLQHGAVVIPKSTHPERIRNNIDLFSFEIDMADMNALDAYSMQGERTRYCWDPTDVF
ncbi:MAG: NADP-dependent oxidoreductase domain-containing protein [Benniella sp.]|nr:MAG: NADP-dependent oxidoreductase domain-containing protein [Benniella sp.]